MTVDLQFWVVVFAVMGLGTYGFILSVLFARKILGSH